MNKTVIGTVIIVILLIGGWYVYQNQSSTPTPATGLPAGEAGEPIKIGLIAPLTGDIAFIGEAAKNSAELALAKIGEDKDFLHKYELVVEDDAFDPKKTASAINKLISIDKVSAVISLGSGGANVVSPIAEQSKVPHIGLASDANVAKGEYNFIHWTRPQEEVDMMIAELGKRKLTKVAIVGVNQQGFEAISLDFKAKAKDADITVVADETFNTGTRDFKSIIAKTQKAKPDVYLLGIFSPEIEIIGKQMKDLGVKTPLTSIESFGLSSDPTIFEGAWFIDAAVVSGNFADGYKAKYNKEPGPTSGNVYDAINLFAQAIEKTKNSGIPTGEEIIKQLSQINSYSGAFGSLSVTADGAFISQPSVKIIKNGKAELLN